MDTYTIKLKYRREVAEQTTAVYFEKPQGFEFRAGQFTTLILPHSKDISKSEMRRTFSIASAPGEEDLMFAVRVRDSAFKQKFAEMPIGSEVVIYDASGSFVLPRDSSRPLVFLAGGIGITPFRSMLIYATEKKLPCQIFLFYSNRRPEDAAFLEELTNLQDENPNYKFIATMTQLEKSNMPWDGETGYISKEMLGEYIDNLKEPIYYIAGSPGMVLAMRQMLESAGIDYENIHEEQFGGY